ncbi:MAG: hypothetical protein E3K37_12265 [Candidatus Kuenenia sp.]|nr:hypothetical protein [Candidatus Kuenenia hertensis]
MLEDISQFQRDVIVSINGQFFHPKFDKYRDMLGDCFLIDNKEFIQKYKIDYKGKIENMHLIDIFNFKTFDGGEIEVELHKYDGDYRYVYNMTTLTLQSQKIQDDFEACWVNDELAILLF